MTAAVYKFELEFLIRMRTQIRILFLIHILIRNY